MNYYNHYPSLPTYSKRIDSVRGEHTKMERASCPHELQHRQRMLLHESYLRAELSMPHDLGPFVDP
jgi:hypothetical protein